MTTNRVSTFTGEGPALPVTPSTQLKLTAKLMLVEAGLEYTPEQSSREELFVVGMGERDSDPEWRFSATASTPLVGDESLTLIVRVPAGIPGTGPHHPGRDRQTAPSRPDPYRAELPPALRTIGFR